MKSPITSHVLDMMRGKPATGVPAVLEMRNPNGEWTKIGGGMTDAEGRIGNLLPDDHRLRTGSYRLTFDTATYYAVSGQPTFYPYVQIVFEVHDANQHYHVPLLLSPFGYSTYRGS